VCVSVSVSVSVCLCARGCCVFKPSSGAKQKRNQTRNLKKRYSFCPAFCRRLDEYLPPAPRPETNRAELSISQGIVKQKREMSTDTLTVVDHAAKRRVTEPSVLLPSLNGFLPTVWSCRRALTLRTSMR